ncbi:MULTISPECIES: non-oxidative hydroxyarylic acid decarboxylases subunit C [Streptomyces]|uniref:non-oxidative hydroxyarylic acid decarboxylases subunit C n=1 Tax=Streptomyces TaxID=1883 RepID=UPI000F747676|nr:MULTISPECIES: non-oxidative hydroxyarylic acid decarboxylases subunit C [Streptomyces]RSS03547.1 UbiD family decarboxylase [Streptomyces sp. WAC00469]WTD46278.1 UbiD family decarboxylase [Streptomyces thermoviolaceus]GGV66029.1 phenolic acid decarboxylase subunit C [Streptomyces thermoviolaceus subsp. apingens]
MPYDDLRGFLTALEDAGQLLRITDEVQPEPDIAAAANAAPRLGDAAPALYFDNVRGFTSARIAMNVHGSWANHALALGLPKETPAKEQVAEFIRRWDDFPVAPEWREDPPWAQNTLEGDDVDIFEVLPLIRLNDGDGGFYIDKAAVVSKDPDDPENSGKQNVGVYRIEVKGKRKLALQPVPMHDIALHLRTAEERGEDLPVAITLGNDPVISIAASTPMKYEENEYELAGALRGAPAPISRAPLTGLPVPWGAEVVIEGVIEGRKREIEGPFGEFTGHYSGGRSMPVIRIDRISYRTDPVFEHLYLGMPWTECDYLIAANTAVPLYKQLKADFPEVQAVNASYTHGLVVIVSTKKRYGGFAKAVGLRVLTTPHGLGYATTVIVVDEDVDPFNLPQVMWALSTKMNPAGDLIRIPNLPVVELAPQAQTPGVVDKLVIDATTPVGADRRGNYGTPVHDLPETAEWLARLQALAARR